MLGKLGIQQAATLYRNALQVFESVDEARAYMTNRTPGLTARVIIVDITAMTESQSGAKSRKVCKALSEAVREQAPTHMRWQIEQTEHTYLITRECIHAHAHPLVHTNDQERLG